MVVEAVVDPGPGGVGSPGEGGGDDAGDAEPEEHPAVDDVPVGAAGRGRSDRDAGCDPGRDDVVIEAAPFVIGDEQDRAFPAGPAAQRVEHLAEEGVAGSDVGPGVVVVTPPGP